MVTKQSNNQILKVLFVVFFFLTVAHTDNDQLVGQ